MLNIEKNQKTNKVYMCIDLKSFYASVECVERGLDPFKTNLVVADKTRKGAICLAVSPKLKTLGVKNRCRLYEIPKNIDVIIAKPRMKKYIEYSAKIYKIYLKFFSKNDIHPYSIDEVFIDVTDYLYMYKMSAKSLAKKVLEQIFKETEITATCGIGDNLFVAKVALDIMAKKIKENIAVLLQEDFEIKLGEHLPLTDFWYIGQGTVNRLKKLGIYTLKDINNADENILYKTFGVNAEILIDHARGIEPTTIEQIKKYVPQSQSLSSGQILFKDYSKQDARIVLMEMIDNLCLELIKQNLVCSVVGIGVSYSNHQESGTGASKRLTNHTNVFSVISKEILSLFDSTTLDDVPIRKLNISLSNLIPLSFEKIDLLTDFGKVQKEREILKTINNIKEKHGKNSILRGISLTQNATMKYRNSLIGGHNSGEED